MFSILLQFQLSHFNLEKKKMVPEYSVTLPYNTFHCVSICSVHLCPHAIKTAPDIRF